MFDGGMRASPSRRAVPGIPSLLTREFPGRYVLVRHSLGGPSGRMLAIMPGTSRAYPRSPYWRGVCEVVRYRAPRM